MLKLLSILCILTSITPLLVRADPPPLIPEGQTAQVFSPDDLLTIDLYPPEKQALVAFSIVNALPLPPLVVPPDSLPSMTNLVISSTPIVPWIEHVTATNIYVPPREKTFIILPDYVTTDGTNHISKVTLEIKCDSDSEFWRLRLDESNPEFILLIPEYRRELGGETNWHSSDIVFSAINLNTNNLFKIRTRQGEL